MSDRSEYTNIGNSGSLRAKATVYDHQGNVIDIDELQVDVPAGGRVVLTHAEYGDMEPAGEDGDSDE